MTDAEAFWRAYIATRTLLGGAPLPGEVPPGTAQSLVTELASGERAQRARVLAAELARVARALEARRPS